MPRYIEAEKVKDLLCYYCNAFSYCRHRGTRCDNLSFVDSIPTANVAEVKSGHWEKEFSGNTSDYGTIVMFKCSECEKMSVSKYSYCPYCGAKMDGDNNG